MTLLTNLTARRTTPEDPASVVFEAPAGCGCVVSWRQTYGSPGEPDACVCNSESHVPHGRIAGTGTEEPRRSDDSLAGESATGFPTPRPLKTTGGSSDSIHRL